MIDTWHKCIQFLNKNSSFDCAGGNGLDFELDKKIYGKIIKLSRRVFLKEKVN